MVTKRAAPHTRWHDALDALVAPLTRIQKDGIRAALPQKKARQFIRNWSRISEVAWYHGAACHVGDTVKSNATLLAKDEKAVKAALKALKALDKQLDTFHRHWVPIWKTWFPLDNHDNSEAFVRLVKGLTESQQERVKAFGTKRGVFRPARRGRPRTAAFYVLQTLRAYFSCHEWDDTVTPTNWKAGKNGNYFARESRFVATALAVVGGDSLSVETRKALIDDAPAKLKDAFRDENDRPGAVADALACFPRLTAHRKRKLLAAWRR